MLWLSCVHGFVALCHNGRNRICASLLFSNKLNADQTSRSPVLKAHLCFFFESEREARSLRCSAQPTGAHLVQLPVISSCSGMQLRCQDYQLIMAMFLHRVFGNMLQITAQCALLELRHCICMLQWTFLFIWFSWEFCCTTVLCAAANQ